MIGRKLSPKYGQSLGSFISQIFNAVKPKLFGLAQSAIRSDTFKKITDNAKEIARNTGTQILDDISSGKNVGDSLKKNLKDGAKQIVNDSAQSSIASVRALLNQKSMNDELKKTGLEKRRKGRKVLGSKKQKIDIFS